MIVRELVTRLGFSVNDTKLKSYERGIGNIKTQADSAANAFRGMFAAFIGFQGLKSLANTADEMQSLEARIGMLPQTVGDAADSFNEISKCSLSGTSISRLLQPSSSSPPQLPGTPANPGALVVALPSAS